MYWKEVQQSSNMVRGKGNDSLWQMLPGVGCVLGSLVSAVLNSSSQTLSLSILDLRIALVEPACVCILNTLIENA